MSRTHRKHASKAQLARQGGIRKADKEPKAPLKTYKQKRPNERARLRKEYL